MCTFGILIFAYFKNAVFSNLNPSVNNPAIREGSCLKKGDLLGEIRRLDGSLMYRYESELDGMVFYYTLSLGVSEGEPLVAYGEC